MAFIELDVRALPNLGRMVAGYKAKITLEGSIVNRTQTFDSDKIMFNVETAEGEQGMIGRFEHFMRTFEKMRDKDGNLKVNTGSRPQGDVGAG